MHAISSNPEDTTTENTPPCLYVQLNSLDDHDDNDNATVPELRLIPKDRSLLDTIFQSFCQGAERNPDPDDDDTDNGGGGFFFHNGSEMEGQDDDRFDDDDEADR
jgi:nucleotide-sensitive chloride channel 1A